MTRPRNKSAADDASGQAGFTLLELLVSLMILTLILAFIPGTLRLGQRVWETDNAIEERAAFSTFRRYVEQRLTQAIPIHLRDRTRGLHIEFTGEPERLGFVAPAPMGPAGGGIYRFELAQAETGSGGRPLILRQSLYRPDGVGSDGERTAPAPSMTHRSPERIAAVRFRYFGATEPGRPSRWQNQWPRTDSLPELVEITVAPGDGAAEQRSVIPLRLKATP